MTDTPLRHVVVPALALALSLALPSAAAAQAMGADGMHNATHLGGPTAFYAPPLKSAASLTQMVASKGMTDDIRTVLRDSGIPQTASDVLAAFAGARTSSAAGSCDAATPADGSVVACDFQPGSTLLWMAYRPDVRKGIRTPGRLERVRWSGTRPFKALLFRVTNDHKIYTFVLPLACGNLSLMSIKEIAGEPVTVSMDRECDPKTGVLRATFTAAGKDLERVQRVNVAINGQPAGELTAASWSFRSDKAGDYTFEAIDTSDRAYALAPRMIRQESCPAPPAPPAEASAPTVAGTSSTGTSSTGTVPPAAAPEPLMSKRRPALFFDILGGKERRVRPIEDTDLEYAQCSPLLGLKFGVAKRFENDWEVAGAVGVALSMVNGDKVRESALFVDVEVNKYVGGGAFIGTGLSLWDLTRSDTFTPAWLVHAAAPLTKHAKYPVFLMIEGRLFFDNIDNVSSNYQVWAGVRIKLGR